AIVGVNSDSDREKLKEALKTEGITWRSFWNGGLEGPISLRWNIEGWPTMYILDTHGVIRWKGTDPNDRGTIDKTIEALLREAGAVPRK
ncbi:MAG TPA: hypothetical protein VGF55_15540, partial [Gemmataceae bacterium]